MREKSVRKALVFAILAVLFWSTSPTAFKLGLRYQDTFQLLTGATITSALILGLLLLPGKRYKELAGFGWKDLWFSMLMGLMNPVAYYLILFKAYSILPAQVAQPLNMIWPIVLVIISIPLLKQKIGWKSIGAMLISFSGIVLVSLQGGGGGKDPENRLGILLALSTSVVWAIYFIYNTRDKKDPVARLFLNFLFAAILLLVVGLLRGKLFAGTPQAWGTAIYVGIFEMGITFVLWLLAMQYAPTTDRISNLVFMAPFLNLLIVRMVLKEEIFLTTLYGIILLVTGILIQNMISRDAKKR
ncbi:MAG: DMT family transporter [Bacteroidetes bacterium]|nr:DMT family transporter [Bacteroidota bacterium]